MVREKRPLNPVEAWRKQQKSKAHKKRKEARAEHRKRIPPERRNPSLLLAEIEKFRILEYEGKLNSDGKLRKKHLIDQFHSLRMARLDAGLEPIELPDFDVDLYEARKKKAISGVQREENPEEDDEDRPPLPEGEPPVNGIPGLPPFLAEPLFTSDDETGPAAAPVIEAPPVLVGAAHLMPRGSRKSQQKAASRPTGENELDQFLEQFRS